MSRPRITIADFPQAPRGAYVTPEGWLVIGEQAWTVDEWRIQRGWYRAPRKPASRRPPAKEQP